MVQVQRLFLKLCIAISISKQEALSHKIFLTRERIKLLQDRNKAFKFLSYYREENSYICITQYSYKLLKRKNFTNLSNKFIK